MSAFLLAAWTFLKSLPWYVYGFGVCFLLGGCACHAVHRAIPVFAERLP